MPDRLRPRARQRHHHRARGARSGPDAPSSTPWPDGCSALDVPAPRRRKAVAATGRTGRHPRGARDRFVPRRNCTLKDAHVSRPNSNRPARRDRSIPDYPSPGIMFRDITTLLGNARAFRRAVDELVQPWAGFKIDKVAGIEARGFILGGAVAHQMLGRLRADPQEGQAALQARHHRLFARIRHRRNGDA